MGQKRQGVLCTRTGMGILPVLRPHCTDKANIYGVLGMVDNVLIRFTHRRP